MAGVLLNFVYFLLAFDMWAIWSFATAIAWSNLFFSLLEKNEKYVHKEYNKLDWQCFSLQNVSYALANLYYSKVFGDIVIYPFPSAWNQPKSYPYPFSLKQLWNKEYSKNLSDPDMQMIHGFCTPSEQYMDFLKRREKIVKEIKKALITHQLDEIKSHCETAESAFLRNIFHQKKIEFVSSWILIQIH